MRAGEIRRELKNRGLKPNKLMGQNFLMSEKVLDKIVEAAEIVPTDTILEVGPGLGALTERLIATSANIIATEKDRALSDILGDKFGDNKNFRLINDDILKLKPSNIGLVARNFKVVANLPYYLTSKFLRDSLESEAQPVMLVLLIQKEVAERICAHAPRGSILSNSVQYYGQPKIVARVPRELFHPSPKVDSAVIKIVLKNDFDPIFDKLFFKVLKCGFSSPRKILLSNLSNAWDKVQIAAIFNILNLKPNIRAQELEISDWVNIAKNMPRIE
jgi:16S rRNA (adenine1518-N6/adenine1519-N6)-dimethyltransferase